MNKEELLKDYIDEAEELSQAMFHDLLNLEQGTDDPDKAINNLFRNFHTLKSISGSMRFDNIKNFLHRAESLLELIRSDKVRLDDNIINIISDGLELIDKFVQGLTSGKSPDFITAKSNKLTSQINEYLHNKILSNIDEAESIYNTNYVLNDDEIKLIRESQKKGLKIYLGKIFLREGLEDNFLPLFLITKRLEEFGTIVLTNPHRDNLSGYSGSRMDFVISTGESHDTIRTSILSPRVEQVYLDHISHIPSADRISLNDLELDNLITPEMIERFIPETNELLDEAEQDILLFEKEPDNLSHIDNVFRNIHTLKGNSGFFGFSNIEKACMEYETVLDEIRNNPEEKKKVDITSLLKSIDNIRGTIGELEDRFKDFVKDNGKKEKKKEEAEYKALGKLLIEMGETSPEAVMSALEKQKMPIGELLIESGETSNEAVEKALKLQKDMLSKSSTFFSGTGKRVRKDIRVDTDKLDRLFDLVGELITAEGMVVNNPDLQNLDLPNFTKSANNLNKITREIQEITTEIRMIPLEGLFSKMIRLVRDLSKKFDKKINFKIYGAETEMDKNVIEQISDPLVHILRNSIDHGIEKKEERLKIGKDETANLSLSAKYEGNEIWISVIDDGPGLNKEKIIERAIERNLTTHEKLENMKDSEIWNFILEPGFTTAEKLSDISGRGVGMDVVKKNLEKLRGKITINSRKGQGTEMILKIPLTMAIVDGISVAAGNNQYSIPINDIIEFFKVRADQIVNADQKNQVINLRGEILPVIKLWEVFKVSTGCEELVDGVIVVIQHQQKKACLLVDEVIGNQQIVVKSLSKYIENDNGLSGCSVMSNGDVSLIIDTGTLLNKCLE